MVLSLGLKGKKKCRSGTKEKQLRGKVMTLSSQYFCTDMLPPARNSLIWPEIILILVNFDCGLTIVKYPIQKWYKEKLVP